MARRAETDALTAGTRCCHTVHAERIPVRPIAAAIAATPILLILALPASGEERPLPLPPAGEPLVVVCPLGRDTRLVFPEPLRRLRGLGQERSALGLSIVQAAPEAILLVHPKTHPTRGVITFVGPTLEVRLVLETAAADAADGPPVDLRLTPAPPAPTSAPAPTPEPIPAASSPPAPAAETAPLEAQSTDTPAASPGTASASAPPLDLDALLAADPVRIDRREGLPGQPAMRLVDAWRSEERVFLRFRLERARHTRITRVSWEQGEIRSFTQRLAGDTLQILVELPRAPLSRRTRVTLETDGGLTYRFPLRAGTLRGLLRGFVR